MSFPKDWVLKKTMECLYRIMKNPGIEKSFHTALKTVSLRLGDIRMYIQTKDELMSMLLVCKQLNFVDEDIIMTRENDLRDAYPLISPQECTAVFS
mgnify:CR=1 FL=1